MIELQFLRNCLGIFQPLPQFDDEQWESVYDFCLKQSLVGLGFYGIERMSLKPPKELLLQWFALSEQIKQRNILVNSRCLELWDMFAEAGFETCILKGQGNALMYPKPYSRTPGDIDIWVRPKTKGRCKKDDVRRTIEYIKGINPKGKVCYHHIDYGLYKGIEVEVHFRPSFMFNPTHNHRLQKWFNKMADGGWQMAELPDEGGCIPVPSVEFNIIFQLSHIYNHVLHEGIGLRQMVDYYYVLKKFRDESLEFRDSLKSIELEETLKYLGLWKFAGAVMYVMREVFGLEENYMIAPVDEKRGRTLINEILKGGNFGKYSGLTQHSTGGKYFLKHWRNLHFVKEYPSEALSEPIFRTWHFFWRLGHR